jgi:Mce-associated membrane protein
VTAKETSAAKDTQESDVTDVEAVEETAEVEPTEDTTEADATEDAEALDDVGPPPGRLKRFVGSARKLSSAKVLYAVLGLLLVGSLTLLGLLFYYFYLPDRATSAGAAKAAVSAASDGTVAVLSYSPDTLDHDFSSAKSHLTGDFLSYYDQFTTQIVAPAAKQKSVKTTAVVLRAALTDFHPNSANVLLFVNQTTQSKDRPEPSMTSSSVLVTLTKADDKWLISSFNPV